MSREFLSEEQKNKILDLFFNTKTTYKGIAKDTETSIEQVYDVIDKYCKENNYKTIRRTENGVEFEKQIEQTRERSIKNAQMIKKWADENGRKPRQNIKGVKTTNKIEEETKEQEEVRLGIALNNLRSYTVQGYEGKSLEEIEDEDDREIVRIIRYVDTKYKSNKPGRIKELTSDKNTVNNNHELAKSIWNLIKTRKATVEQIKIIAQYYGVNLEELEFYGEDKIESIDER